MLVGGAVKSWALKGEDFMKKDLESPAGQVDCEQSGADVRQPYLCITKNRRLGEQC